MGLGRYKNGKLDLVVVANFTMSASDWTEWQRGLSKASELLYDATQGQVQFGTFFVCDNEQGLDTAEFILHASGDPSYAYSGQFGTAGKAMHLMPYARLQPLSIVHELGHLLWSLGDEYSAEPITDEIDKSAPAPDQRTIPIKGANWAKDELVSKKASAKLTFEKSVERRTVVSNTATSVVVEIDFSDLPTNAISTEVEYQTPAECGAPGENFCIMTYSRDAAGHFDDKGVWQAKANPVTEFCTPSNHDLDHKTSQHAKHKQSCWETILARPGFSTLTAPDPAGAGPTVGWTTPSWVVLEKQARFALVLDRSFSMIGHKMSDAQHGAAFWLEHCSESKDLLTIVAYDDQVERLLALQQVDALALDTHIKAINALTPRGTTNVRDGLNEALSQIQSPGTRSAVQVALLLTDGIHNEPPNTSAEEVLPAFQNAGVRIYSLGIGSPQAVDMDTLDRLADGTQGKSYTVGDNQPGVIEKAMVEICAEVRGGIITTTPSEFPDSFQQVSIKPHEPGVGGLPHEPGGRRPDTLGHAVGARPTPSELREKTGELTVRIPVDVEEGCSRVTFTLIFPVDRRLRLSLVDPSGADVSFSDPGVHLCRSSAPHEFVLVDNPSAGRWHMVAVRTERGARLGFHAIAGGENPKLQVFGGATPKNALGTPVRIWASARWIHELSGLDVWATILGPDGNQFRLRLQDDQKGMAKSGLYQAFFETNVGGRFTGKIEIQCSGHAVRAMPQHILGHSSQSNLDLSVPAPNFVRVVPFFFDVGARPPVVDKERRDEIESGSHGGGHLPTGVTRLCITAHASPVNAQSKSRDPVLIGVSVTDARGLAEKGLVKGNFEVTAIIVGPGGADVFIEEVFTRPNGFYGLQIRPVRDYVWVRGTFVFGVTVVSALGRAQCTCSLDLDT